jgi:5-(carboxyamino)imidazole ribonucleotide synthase
MQLESSTPLSTPRRVGVIGAGQLALMLMNAAKSLGMETHVLAPRANDPATQSEGVKVIVGDLTDPAALNALFRSAECVAFESELVDLSALDPDKLAAGGEASQTRVYPSLAAMSVCSDKLRQKEMLTTLKIPTAPWIEFPQDGGNLRTWFSELSRRFPAGWVFKWSRGGYDGIGTLVVRPGGDLTPRIERFFGDATASGVAIFAEELIPFAFELAVITTRALDGRAVQYPAVLTRQENGVCVEVRGPATSLGAAPEIVSVAKAHALSIGDHLGLVGTYAVEFFVREDGHVLVNEIAPRVHNSGHFSLDAAATSQFENHWLALTGQPLGSTQSTAFFGMVNVLGPKDFTGAVHRPFSLATEDVRSHWYGKAVSRPGRKLGHVNVKADDVDTLNLRMQRARSAVAEWHGSFVTEELANAKR